MMLSGHLWDAANSIAQLAAFVKGKAQDEKEERRTIQEGY